MSVNFNSITCLNEIIFDNEDLIKIIQGLDINKAHGHDNLSVKIIKMRPAIKASFHNIYELHGIRNFP